MRDQRLDTRALVGVEVAAVDEVVGQRPGLVAGPGLEGGDELALLDQADLQREQAEEQVTFGLRSLPSWAVPFRRSWERSKWAGHSSASTASAAEKLSPAFPSGTCRLST